MKLKITNQFGAFQFWHMDCDKSNHESPMHDPVGLDDGVKQFKCAGCGRIGQVTLPVIMVGEGVLEEVKQAEKHDPKQGPGNAPQGGDGIKFA